jgi:micrococcal nuclease
MRVIDGDTVEAEIDVGFDIRLLKHIRVDGVDAPEMSKQKALAKKAQQFTREFTLMGPCVIRDPKAEKYGRVLSDIYCNGLSLSKALIKSGNAVPYNGGKRE